uniref:Uncharacterized protein n=1 Tax=Tetraselmis sp. GSL018 TaxID=582737 RepID=A0A061S579_9CHLO
MLSAQRDMFHFPGTCELRLKQ